MSYQPVADSEFETGEKIAPEAKTLERRSGLHRLSLRSNLLLVIATIGTVLLIGGFMFVVITWEISTQRASGPWAEWEIYNHDNSEKANPGAFSEFKVKSGQYLRSTRTFECPVENVQENMAGVLPITVTVTAKAWQDFSFYRFEKYGTSFTQSVAAYACYRYVYDAPTRFSMRHTAAQTTFNTKFSFRSQPLFWRANNIPITGIDGRIDFGKYIRIGGVSTGPVLPVSNNNWKQARLLLCQKQTNSLLGLEFCDCNNTVDHPVPGKTVIDVVFE